MYENKEKNKIPKQKDSNLNKNSSKNYVTQRQLNKTGLPDNLKSGIENLSGYSMDDVKVHYNSDKPAQLNAHAYAQGSDIHIASGQEKHLPHEAWHVVQQKQGRVKPTMQMKGKVNINDDAGLERKADETDRKIQQGNSIDMKKNIYFSKNIESETIVQRMAKGAGSLFLMSKSPWSKNIDKEEFETYLIERKFGDDKNPYEKISNETELRNLCDQFLTIKHEDKLGNGMESIEEPDLDNRVEGFVATIISKVLTEIIYEDQKSWKKKNPQWIPVNGGVKGEGVILYRFCDYNKIEKMLPRLAWETYDDTVESVKAKKRSERDPNPDHTKTWNVISYLGLKDKGEKCLKLSKENENPQEESEILDRAFDHMGRVMTRLSPFVSLSEDLNLLKESTCPTMQSIIRSDENLEDLEETEELPGHKFHVKDGVQRASGYQRAPHIVKFEIPKKFIVTPEMVDHYKGYTQEDIGKGLGLKAMRDAKERLFLGTDVWRYAVEVASNPF